MATVMNEKAEGKVVPLKTNGNHTGTRPSDAQLRYLRMGLEQAGGKLPLFDENGQEIKPATIKSCIEKGWAEPWFNNPIKPDWLVCKLTDAGRKLLS